jgi:hypothetical protein
MASGFLRVEGDHVVDGNGKLVVLRGAGLGGWMNMENFITGYPGHEHQHRAAMLEVLGQEKYEFFFDKFLECKLKYLKWSDAVQEHFINAV